MAGQPKPTFPVGFMSPRGRPGRGAEARIRPWRVNCASRGRTLTWKPVTESNLSLCASAQRAAVLLGCALVEGLAWDRPDGTFCNAGAHRYFRRPAVWPLAGPVATRPRGRPGGSARRPAVSRGSVPGRDPWRDRIRQLRVPHPIRHAHGAAEPAAIQLGHAGRRTSFPAGSPNLALPRARCTTRSRRRLRPGTGCRWRRGTGGQHKGIGHSMLTSRYCRTERPRSLTGTGVSAALLPGGRRLLARGAQPAGVEIGDEHLLQHVPVLRVPGDPSSNTLVSCWVMAAIFSCPVPVSGTGISW